MEKIDLSRIILTLVLFISGCSLVEPFVDRRREAGAENLELLYVGESKPERPVICYNILTTDYPTVKNMADMECKKYGTGTEAKPYKQTAFTCRLLVPSRIYFKCIGEKTEIDEIKEIENEFRKVNQ